LFGHLPLSGIKSWLGHSLDAGTGTGLGLADPDKE